LGQTKKNKFNKDRERLNDIVLRHAGKNIKRFFNLDTQVYNDGILPVKTKELLGLVSSLVLRCDDCIKYHLDQCNKNGVQTEEIEETFAIGLIVGGSITIPHIRYAFEYWEKIIKDNDKNYD